MTDVHYRLCEVALKVRHRCLLFAGVRALPATAHIVHPSPTAFARACGRFQIELRKQSGELSCGFILDAIVVQKF